jgi:hypothetical protein
MAAGRITQPGVSRVGHPCYAGLHEWHFLSLVLFKPFSDLAYKNTKGTSSCSQLNYIYTHTHTHTYIYKHTHIYIYIYIYVVMSIFDGYMAYINAWSIKCLTSKSNKDCCIYLSIKQSISNGPRLCLVRTILLIFNVMQHRLKCDLKKSRMTSAVPRMFPNNVQYLR